MTGETKLESIFAGIRREFRKFLAGKRRELRKLPYRNEERI